MTRLVQIADIHFGTEDPAAVSAARDIIKSTDADGVIVCGDLTQKGRQSEFDAALRWLKSLGRPYLTVPGNHDTPYYNLVSRATSPFVRFSRSFGEAEPVRRFENVTVVGLNTSRGWQVRRNWAEGRVNIDDLSESLKRAEKAETDHVLMTCHHPFRGPPGAPLQTRTHNGRSASDMLGHSVVKILLSGHVHTPSADIWEQDGGKYLSLTAGTLSTRRREWPCSFNILNFDAGMLSVSRYDLTSDGFQMAHAGQWRLRDLEQTEL